MDKKIKSKKGFTLIELMVTISIIGLLSTLAIIALNNSRAKGRDAKRLADVKAMEKALDMYYDKYGYYPKVDSASTWTTACGTRWCNLETTLLPFIKVPRDPLGNQTGYRYYYDSDAGDNNQTYGFMVRLESQINLTYEDGGYYANAAGQWYEIGPQLRYCKKYAGTGANWWSTLSTVCQGGD